MLKTLWPATIVLFGAILVAAPQAVAGDTYCIGALPAGIYDNVVVPANVSCTIRRGTVIQGNVNVMENATLSADGMMPGGIQIAGHVQGDKALQVRISRALVRGSVKVVDNAVLLATSNTILGNVEGDKAERVQLTGNVIEGNIQIKEGEIPSRPTITDRDVVLCGNTVVNGNIHIEKMSGTIIVGAPGFPFVCSRNLVENGSITIENNFINHGSALVIRSNEVFGNVQVFKNWGPAAKTVQGNTVTQDLRCSDNDPAFVGGANFAAKAEDQCS